MKKAFDMRIAILISTVIFSISTIILLVVIPVNCGCANPMFDSRLDDKPYIEQMRGIIRAFDLIDKIDFAVWIASGLTTAIFVAIKKIRQYLKYG